MKKHSESMSALSVIVSGKISKEVEKERKRERERQSTKRKRYISTVERKPIRQIERMLNNEIDTLVWKNFIHIKKKLYKKDKAGKQNTPTNNIVTKKSNQIYIKYI